MAPFDDQHTDVPGTVYLVDSMHKATLHLDLLMLTVLLCSIERLGECRSCRRSRCSLHTTTVQIPG
jgi:hypothetical protein